MSMYSVGSFLGHFFQKYSRFANRNPIHNHISNSNYNPNRCWYRSPGPVKLIDQFLQLKFLIYTIIRTWVSSRLLRESVIALTYKSSWLLKKYVILLNASLATSSARSDATKQCGIWRFCSANGSINICVTPCSFKAASMSRIST